MHKSSDRTASVTFATTVKLGNGVTLPAGTYRMEVQENAQSPTVTFSHDSQVVATAPAKIETEASKNPTTEIDLTQDAGSQDLTAIRPGGWKVALHFGPEGQ
jgi:hypothetical protein